MWWTAVANENSRVVLKLTGDLRLLAAVAGAVGHLAEQAGFDARAQADLIAAAEEACRDTFPLLTPDDPTLGVTIQGFPDRLEVTLEHQGRAVPTAGLETFAIPGAEGAGGLSALGLLVRVDRVQYDVQGGASRMTLIKYLRGRPTAT